MPNGEKIIWDSYRWNQPESILVPGSKTSKTFSALQQPLNIRVTNADNKVLFQRNYKYDKSGNILQSKTEEGNINYQYDALNRLKQVNPDQSLQQKGLQAESYIYDLTDNRIGSLQQLSEWQYNTNGQLILWSTSNQKHEVSYDANGNLIKEVVNDKERIYQ